MTCIMHIVAFPRYRSDMLVRGVRASWLGLLLGGILAAPTFAGTSQAPPPQPTPVPPPPVPYSLPFQLRPAAAATVLRFDTSVASWESGGRSGSTWVAGLIGTRKLTSRFGLIGRVSFVASNPPAPGTEKSGRLLSNPLVGATFLHTKPTGIRKGLIAAMTLPIGGGGGDSPDPGRAAALPRAIATRSAMDNALFATNYVTFVAGGTLARVTHGSTLQAEATILELLRARGPKSQDRSRTNFTAGIHAGHFFSPKFSAAAELRYQRWLTSAAPVRSNPAARETVTLAAGPRFHFRAGARRWIRPAVTFTWPLDDPLSAQKYRIVQVDVPLSF